MPLPCWAADSFILQSLLHTESRHFVISRLLLGLPLWQQAETCHGPGAWTDLRVQTFSSLLFSWSPSFPPSVQAGPNHKVSGHTAAAPQAAEPTQALKICLSLMSKILQDTPIYPELGGNTAPQWCCCQPGWSGEDELLAKGPRVEPWCPISMGTCLALRWGPSEPIRTPQRGISRLPQPQVSPSPSQSLAPVFLLRFHQDRGNGVTTNGQTKVSPTEEERKRG